MKKIIKKIKRKGILTLKSGVHIGASKESASIGGVDSPVVRRVDNKQPYLPGSSLKGKMRCLLEQVRGCDLGESDEVNDLFGFASDKKPSKIIVRDAYLSNKSVEAFQENEDTDLPFTEVKWENSINRFKGNADHPRQIERVPAGAEFELEFIINIWDGNDDESNALQLLDEGIELLNNDYIGGNGSRGYGHIEIVMDAPQTVYPSEKIVING